MKFKQIFTHVPLVTFLLLFHSSYSQNLDKVGVGNRIFVDTLYIKGLLEQVNEGNEIGFDSTVAILSIALAYSEQIDFGHGKLSALQKLGDYYYQKGFAFQSSDYYMRGLAVAEAQNDLEFQHIFTKKIGDSYVEDDFAKSIYYYKRNLELNRSINNLEKYLLALNDLGIANLLHNKFETAITYFERCLKENDVLKSVKIESAAITNIGVVYSRQNKYDLALNQYKRALPIAQIDGYGDTVPFIKDQMALVYLKLNKYDLALQLASEALNELPDKYDQLKTSMYNTISEAYLKVGDEKNAFSNYKLFATRKLKEDSLKNKQIVSLLNLTFENEQQLQSLNKLNLEIKAKEYRNNIISFSATFLLVLVLITAYFYKIQRDKSVLITKQNQAINELNERLEEKVQKRTKELEQANAELKTKNAEITEALVKGQSLERRRVAVELHDNLGSAITAIKWQLEAIDDTQMGEKEQRLFRGVLGMMKDAYAEIRLLSHNMLPGTFENSGLIGALSKLISDINYSGKINFTLKYDNLTCQLSQHVEIELYSICLELITNILKHSKAQNASLEFSNDEEWVTLLATDDGKGFIETNELKGNGLKHVNGRIESLGGTLEIDRAGEKTKFVVRIKNLVNAVL